MKKQTLLSRKKFIAWSTCIGSLLVLPALLRPSKKKDPEKKVKMLTRDGRLVEVDVSRIPLKRKKITEADLKTWVNKQSSSL
jgi:hypothetical protein